MTKTDVFTFSQELILIGLEASTAEDAIRAMAETMQKHGYVKETFLESVLEREDTHPTGMPTDIPVALPHTGTEHCLKPGICVAMLKTPVEFGMMSDPQTRLSVRLIFMLSVVDPSAQVKVLQRLIDFFQHSTKISALLDVKDKKAALAILNAGLHSVSNT